MTFDLHLSGEESSLTLVWEAKEANIGHTQYRERKKYMRVTGTTEKTELFPNLLDYNRESCLFTFVHAGRK